MFDTEYIGTEVRLKKFRNLRFIRLHEVRFKTARQIVYNFVLKSNCHYYTMDTAFGNNLTK